MTKPALVFVHGLANGKDERVLLRGRMRAQFEKHGCGAQLESNDISDAPIREMTFAEWRSRGSWTTDLLDLGHPDQIRANEAVEDVGKEIRSACASGETIVVAHSMGQVLARLAITQMSVTLRSRITLISAGGPIGNPALFASMAFQPWFSLALNRSPRCTWIDVINPDDRICCDRFLGHEKPPGCGSVVQIDVPGKPLPFDAIGEHGGYFDSPAFFGVVKHAVRRIESESEAVKRA